MAGIELINVHKQYRVEDRTVPVLRGIGLQIPERQITVILGRSGCGKTTRGRFATKAPTAPLSCSRSPG